MKANLKVIFSLLWIYINWVDGATLSEEENG
jgi:hypothetical protein